jgi:cysteine desulfurase
VTYLDAASGEPLHPAAREMLLTAYDEGWADPARLYRDARRARMLLDNAREIVAAAAGARPDEVVFTGSGTQACHLGVLGALAGRRRERSGSAGSQGVLVTSAVEHSAVLQAGAWHIRRGGRHDTVGVDVAGVVDVAALSERLARGDVDVVAVQSANHEVGTVQPVADVAALAAERGAAVVVDASQTLPWGPAPTRWNVLAGSAHKWGGPAGVGVLAVRRRTRFRSVLPEDERGSGLVPGFENVPGALAAAAALRARREEAAALERRLRPLVDLIRERVPVLVDDVEVVGHPSQRLPHLVTFSCLYVDGEALLTALDAEGFAVSSGSSCTASTLRPSHVLEAMGVLTHGNVRVSLSRDTAAGDVERFLDVLPGVVAGVRAQLGADRL